MRKDQRGTSVPASTFIIRRRLHREQGADSMKGVWLMLLCILMASSAGTGWAEEKIKVGEVVVTASKIEESVEQTTSEVTVIKGEDIKKMDVVFLPEVLKKIPDLSIVQGGGDGKVASVFLRGADPKNTLVLIDGVKVNSNTTGGFDFSAFPVADIERIEIVKGAQSTMYGSEAVAGVINIITKKGEGKPTVSASFEGGSFGTYYPSLTVSGSEKSFTYRVTGSYFNTEGISAAKDGSEKDGYRNAFLSWKLGVKPTENSELEIFGNYSYARSELDDFDFISGRAVDALNYVQRGNNFLLAARGKLYLFDKWEQVLTVSTYRDSLTFSDPNNVFNNFDTLNTRQLIDWQHNLYLLNTLTLTAGFEYRKDGGENQSSSGGFDDTINNKALYLNGILKLLGNNLIFNAGVRYDDNDMAGSKITYRFGASYDFKDAGLLFRTSYGTGFRAPSFNDLFFPFYGNPNLKPEDSKSFDAQVVKTLFRNTTSLSLSYFWQDYTNLIQADPLTFTAANIARASVQGVEANLSVRPLEGVEVRAGYTYLDTEDKDTHLPLIRRPVNKFTGSLGYSTGTLSVLADYIYVGSRYDSTRAAQTGTKLAPYSLVNLSGNYRVYKNFTLFARIENLLDKDYEEIFSYGTKGISFYGGMRVTF
jgi:vitamin B12 transporter